jgi:hypothetical protein
MLAWVIPGLVVLIVFRKLAENLPRDSNVRFYPLDPTYEQAIEATEVL